MSAFTDRVGALDRALSARLRIGAAHESAGWVRILRRISQTGSYGVGWIVLFGVVATLLGGWPVALTAAASVMGTLVINTLVKRVIARPRPGDGIGGQPSSHSMPSAHTSMAVVGAAAMTVIEPSLGAAWWSWAAVLSVSRITLGMHYVGDVIAGAALGGTIAVAVVVPLLHSIG